MVLTKVDDTFLDTDGFRLVKVLRYGTRDVLTPDEASPYGLDSNAIKGSRGIFDQTSMRIGIICGYLQKNRKALPGEFRTYATDTTGVEKFYTWMKSDGTMEIGGDVDNMVRYSKLEEAFNKLKADHDALADKHNQLMADFNALVVVFNAHVHTALNAITTTPGTPSTATGPHSTADITPAKINEIKTL